MSKRIEIEAGDILPFRYSKQIRNGQLNPEKLAELKEVVEGSKSVWDRWVVRETPEGYELITGHHLLALVIERWGKHHKISVQVEPYSDSVAVFSFANGNIGGLTFVEQQDTVVMVKKYLEEHGSEKGVCKVVRSAPASKTGEQHDHGSERCICAFLGKHWTRDKVHTLLANVELHDDLKQIVSPGGDRVKRKGPAPGTIGTESAEILGTLPKSVQSVAARAIGATEIGLPKIAIQQAVKAVKDKPEPVQKQEIKKAIANAAFEQAEAVADRVAVKKLTKQRKPSRATPEVSEEELDGIKNFVKEVKQAQETQSKVALIKVGVPNDVVSAAYDIVKTGFVELSKVRHPDKGGSEVEQQALNAARKWLDTLIQNAKENRK